MHVDRHDHIHVFGWFRTRSELDSWGYVWYVRSVDRGATWESLSGEPVPLPILPDAIVGHSMMVDVDGAGLAMSGVTSVGVDADGRPYVAGRVLDVGSRLVRWDGAQWESIDPGSGFVESPTWQVIDGDFWVFGLRTLEGARRFCARNFTADGPFFPLATTDNGTPDGSYQFESSAVFEGTPFHQGGSQNGRPIYRRCIPSGDEPRIVSVGDNVRQPLS